MAARKTRKKTEKVEQAIGPLQYQVIRRLRLSPATTLQPGDVLTPGDTWPHRRVKQFVDQGYLVPIQASATPVAPAPPEPKEPDGDAGRSPDGASDTNSDGDSGDAGNETGEDSQE